VLRDRRERADAPRQSVLTGSTRVRAVARARPGSRGGGGPLTGRRQAGSGSRGVVAGPGARAGWAAGPPLTRELGRGGAVTPGCRRPGRGGGRVCRAVGGGPDSRGGEGGPVWRRRAVRAVQVWAVRVVAYAAAAVGRAGPAGLAVRARAGAATVGGRPAWGRAGRAGGGGVAADGGVPGGQSGRAGLSAGRSGRAIRAVALAGPGSRGGGWGRWAGLGGPPGGRRGRTAGQAVGAGAG
jgi:translation initiation factor IF-2